MQLPRCSACGGLGAIPYNTRMQLASYSFDGPVALAPMAGITDRPFRQICREWGASYAVAEMLTSDASLWHSRKSRLRMDFTGEAGPRIVQIAGGDAQMLADAARRNADLGAEVIDINMGCPAKKVCRKAAGSALLADEPLVAEILEAVVKAVNVPVTLKFRTGPTREHNNALRIARLAEDCGIQALALHGRSRADAYRGEAEHDTVRAVKSTVSIPVLANGDVSSAQQARAVLAHSGADGLLIGRGAQGRPWLFAQIRALLDAEQDLPDPALQIQAETINQHIAALHAFYGPQGGVRVARKHITWYLEHWPGGALLRRELMKLDCAEAQRDMLAAGLESLLVAEAA